MRVFAYFLRVQKVGRPSGRKRKPPAGKKSEPRRGNISYLLSPPSYLKKSPKKVLDKAPPLWYSI